MNYLGGWVLNSEFTTYLAYGTNTYPYENLINIFLKILEIYVNAMEDLNFTVEQILIKLN